MEKKNLGHAWLGGQIGIVMCLVEGLPKAYIGTVLGLDEESDIKLVLDWGITFPIPEAASVIKKHGEITDMETWKEAGLVTE